jgi:hypothetical protein
MKISLENPVVGSLNSVSHLVATLTKKSFSSKKKLQPSVRKCECERESEEKRNECARSRCQKLIYPSHESSHKAFLTFLQGYLGN